MIKVSGPSLNKVDRNDPRYALLIKTHPRIAAKDATTWGQAASAEAAIRLNWVDLDQSSRPLLPLLDALAAKFRDKTDLVLCGMGGSSLAPEVIAATYRKELFVLDSTDPVYIHHALAGDLRETVAVVGSKSGSTIETASQRALFAEAFRTLDLNPIDHMVIVTDPDSPLDKSARLDGYTVINADPKVGGRFSALTAFGLVPAALLGVDPSVLLDAAADAKAQILETEVAIDIAYLISSAGQYLTYCDSPEAPGLSDWIEQLIAESTGKNQVGRLPVVIESAESGINNLTIGFADGDFDLIVEATLGEHFILWEWVTSLLCYLLKVDPFNQPNVTEAKDRTSVILTEITEGKFKFEMPVFEDNEIAVYSNRDIKNLSDFLQLPISYFAVMAYLTRGTEDEITKLRSTISNETNKPTTFGWGPRFLHSTGQFHKGGQQNGAFIQITADSQVDVHIPNQTYSFAQLIMAQALGDAKALTERDLPLIRLHLKNRSAGITKLLTELN